MDPSANKVVSSKDCFEWHDAIDVDDQTGVAVITIHQFHPHKKCPLMRLPQEIDLHIISFFLLDVEEINPGNEYYCTQDTGSPIAASLCKTYCVDGAHCEMATMRVSRQIYQESARCLHNRLAVIAQVEDDGVGFLQTHWGRGTLDRCVSNIPLQKVKGVWLQIIFFCNQPKHFVHAHVTSSTFAARRTRSKYPKPLCRFLGCRPLRPFEYTKEL